jgi:coproporphyrinogen III oxidase-like Fe-S oxidoreductase
MMSFSDKDIQEMDRIKEAKKDKADLRTVLNRKNFDSFELDIIMNEAD